MEKRIKVTYNLDSELVRQFRISCATLERKQQDIVSALIESYLKKQKST